MENSDEVIYAGTANVVNLLKRAFIFLGEGKFDEANSYAEKTLDIEAENADAYLCKLLADLRLKSLKEMNRCTVDFSDNPNYLKAHNFGDEKRQRVLEAYLKRAAAYAAVENGRHALETLKDCQETARYTEADLNRKTKKGKIRGAVYIAAFAVQLAGIILFILSYTVMNFMVAAPVLLIAGFFTAFIMFPFIYGAYREEQIGIGAYAIFIVTLFGGFGIWGFVMSVILLARKKTDSSVSGGFRKNIEAAENYLKEQKIKAEMEDAVLREFLERENF